MCDIPLEITPEEVIVRALRALRAQVHYDQKKNKLKPAAFRDNPGEDQLSTMRKTHLGNDSCKAHGVRIQGAYYQGFWAMTVAEITGIGSKVADSRDQFCGHSDVSHGYPAPPSGETAEPALLDRYRKFASLARAYVDQDPTAVPWTGPDIT